ncbi:MAG: class I tRNA ligase family protein, partial [Phycisphaerales bacterium]|nr:class I tRNA ligase family protein [Phycisphaerales bacterium]
MAKSYDPSAVEKEIFAFWTDGTWFQAAPAADGESFCVVIPPPNVTGALHLGHALNNTLQDILIRRARMQGRNAFWLVGTDHAGIATQATVEKRIREDEGKSRHDLGRDEMVRRIWEWKEKFGGRIVQQLKLMGCSCDYSRERFTLDDMCAKAVRETFFKLFRDGLIYRGKRLVNWDTHLQTAVADDEVVHETIKGKFYYFKYPIIDPKPGEPEFVHIATTRPETMLGDTAVAVHPNPEAGMDAARAELDEKLKKASEKERPAIEKSIEALAEQRATKLSLLIQLRDMARDGRKVRLPLTDREIPLVCDEWANPALGTGCVKITPAHDPNDYDVWSRHKDEIGMINVLEVDGKINANGGAYQGLDRFDARKKVVADLEAQGLLERIEDRTIEIDHSDRSKTIIEPFVSKQWFVAMGDRDGGIVCGRGTPNEFRSAGLAQAAIDAVDPGWSSPTGRHVRFHPDQDRYSKMYRDWLGEKRDWCISRQ